jgi:hypothetical protein
MVTDIEITQTMAILGGAVSIEFILSLASLMENEYSGSLLLLKGYNLFDSKSLTLPPFGSKRTPSKTNKARREISSDFTCCGFVFEINI